MKIFMSVTTLIISIAILGSCGGESIESTFQKMSQQACDSNDEGFFKYIDKQAVRDNFKKDTVNNFTDGASESKLSERSQGMSGKYEEEMVTEHMETLWANYNNWINIGKSGPLCKMKIININGNSLTVGIPGHPDPLWSFEKSKGTWKLVSIL